MKKNLIIIAVLFLTQQTFSQDSFTNIKFGSNLENGKYVKIDGAQIYYETYGHGTPLLLLHGGLGSIMNFEKNIPDLASDFQVIAMDSPGHGRSDLLDSLSYQLLSDYISKFIDYLELDSLYIMGWSDGGVVGLILAADRKDKVKKLLAIGANSRLDGISDENIMWIKNYMIDWAKNDKNWSDNYLSLTPQPENIDTYLISTQKMWLTDIYVPDVKLESINIPTMIMQGDKDAVKMEHATEMFRKIKNSQLCILPNSSHFVLHERPDLVNEIAIDFFKSKTE